MTPGWPARLADGRVGLRPIRLRDASDWYALRRRNHDWLAPWEATVPEVGDATPFSFATMVRRLRHDARGGRLLPFVVTYEGRLVGQLTVAHVIWGSMRSASLGYWIDRGHAGRGIIPTAVALVTDHCFHAVGLHRVEVAMRPENHASRRVVEKLGFRFEGMRPRYLHIDGDWRDHLVYALNEEEVAGSLLARWQATRATPA
ncbi:MAG TPA: GNAT family protein [Actinomycetes bacterium]|nr:GNAT family protein [Actinomycetes bacterium]